MSRGKQKELKLSPGKSWLTALAILAIIYPISLFIPIISPYTKLPIYIVMCKGMPIAASNFAAGYDYQRPGDKRYAITPFTSKYFCNETEAQTAGYHHFNY